MAVLNNQMVIHYVWKNLYELCGNRLEDDL